MRAENKSQTFCLSNESLKDKKVIKAHQGMGMLIRNTLANSKNVKDAVI